MRPSELSFSLLVRLKKKTDIKLSTNVRYLMS